MHRLLVGICIASIIISLPFAALLILTPQTRSLTPEQDAAPSSVPEPYLPQNRASTTSFSAEIPTSPPPKTSPEIVLGATTPQKQSTQFTPEKLYLLINAHRKEHNLSPLMTSAELETSASLKITDMIAKNYWQHADPTNIESWPLFKQAGYDYLLAGENLSFAINSPWGVFSSWVASPTHNEQLLTSAYAHMGAAIDCETYQKLAEQPCIVVLHLGKR